MTDGELVMRGWHRPIAAFMLVATVACGGTGPAPAKAPAAAAVANPVSEGSLTAITLSPEAVKRLGIETTSSAVETMSRTRSVGGEVMARPGGSVTVTAPAAGTLKAADGNVLQPGSRVTRGQAIFVLYAIQPPDRNVRLEAERDAASADAEVTLTNQRVQRLERLLAEGATSARAVEEARAQQKVAEANAAAARARVNELGKSPTGTGVGVIVQSPINGVLQSVAAAAGQTVAASAPLFQVIQIEGLWVRVALFVGERNGVDLTKSATVVALGGAAGPALTALPVAGPPSADPATATSDLFYALQAPGGAVRPGERVSVQLPLMGAEQALVVPTSAIVYDINGGAWVYEATSATTFVRRRIEIRSQAGTRTSIARGLDAGKQVVTAGTAELFGTEFGAGK
jgi:membrane fusion protein, heavy metal efflux system